MAHATSWELQATGEAPSTRGSAVGVRPEPVGRRPSGRGDRELRLSLAPGLPAEGRPRAGRQADPRPASTLSAAQRRRLVTLLGQGALHAGYRTELWTLPRVAELIRDEFGVRYHPAHVWKVLTALGWSCQKPERRAVERDEAAIARWKREDWPRIKKRRSTGRPSRLRR
jgi:transposase